MNFRDINSQPRTLMKLSFLYLMSLTGDFSEKIWSANHDLNKIQRFLWMKCGAKNEWKVWSIVLLLNLFVGSDLIRIYLLEYKPNYTLTVNRVWRFRAKWMETSTWELRDLRPETWDWPHFLWFCPSHTLQPPAECLPNFLPCWASQRWRIHWRLGSSSVSWYESSSSLNEHFGNSCRFSRRDLNNIICSFREYKLWQSL